MRKLKVGLVGCGNIGTSAHLPAYQNLKDLAEVVAVADLVLERAQDAAKKFDVPNAYASVEEMLAAHPDLDYVDICVWTGNHAPVAIAAAKAGKNILLEKPLAATLEQGLAIEKAVKEAGVQFMLAVVTRYGAEQQKFIELRDAGKFGDIYLSKCAYTRRRGTPGGWFTDKKKAGGGPVLDIGVHAIDRTWYLMGRPKPVSCSAEVSYRIGNYQTKGVGRWEPFDKGDGTFDTEDSASVFFRFEGGKSMIAEIAWAINGEGAASTTIYGENEEGYLCDEKPEVTPNNFFEEEIRHYIDCVNTGKTPISPIDDAVTVQRMLDAIYRSAEQHKEVTI